MRGADDLVSMRKRGAVPSVVWIDAETEYLHLPASQEHAHLQLADGESAHRADMRCVVGLTVCVSGPDANRVHALRDAAIAAKAKRVIASVVTLRTGHWIVDEVTDTAGFMTWPQS
jgi:hypothetical protein